MSLFGILSVVTFRLHGTAEQVALLMIIFLLPQAILSPLAGVLVDRWNVRWTMIVSDAVRGCLVLGFLAASNIAVFGYIFLALSILSCLFAPAQTVSIQAVTPVRGLMAANALIAQAGQIMPIIIPAIAGFMIQHLGPNSCFLVDSFSFFFSAAVVFTITINPRRAEHKTEPASFVSSLREGFVFAFRDPLISIVIYCVAASMFALRCFGTLLSLYIRDVIKSGATLFGVLNSVIGAGMIAAAQAAPLLTRKTTSSDLMAYGFFGMSASILVTALLGRVSTVVAAMFFLGFFATLVAIPAQTVLLKATPSGLLGRVSSSLSAILNLAQAGAMVIAAPIAQGFGIRELYAGSAIALFCAGIGARIFLRRALAAGRP